LRVQKRRKTERGGGSPPADSDPFYGAESEKIYPSLSRQFAAKANRRFQFQKRGQLLLGTHNVAPHGRDRCLPLLARGSNYSVSSIGAVFLPLKSAIRLGNHFNNSRGLMNPDAHTGLFEPRRMFGLLVCCPALFMCGAFAYVYGATLHFSVSHGLLLQVRVFFRVLDRAHQHRQGVLLEIRKNLQLHCI
jgi:hypothetical protein